jgi:carboxymethylenebutenolidase
MCFDPSASPPPPPIAGGAGLAGAGELVLEADDGNRFAAFGARATDPDAPGIAILPDVRGLHPFFRELATRFAEAGVHATAMDYFGRSAGIGERGEDFPFREHVAKTTQEGVANDVSATVGHLRTPEGGGAERVFTVGFCFGGRHSFNQASRGLGLAGVIGFYGFPHQRDSDDDDAPVVLARTYASPVLGLFGGADQAIPPQAVDAFRSALDDAGVRNEIVVYDGAPHSFFDRKAETYADASADAWRRMIAFLGTSGET